MFDMGPYYLTAWFHLLAGKRITGSARLPFGEGDYQPAKYGTRIRWKHLLISPVLWILKTAL